MPLTGRPLAPRVRYALAVAAAAAISLAPAAASACPQCALGRDGGAARDLLVAAMMLAPFAVAIAAYRAVARIVRAARAQPEDGEEGGGR